MSKFIKINSRNIDIKALEEAAKILKKGGLVVFPTETVYGIGANALEKKAIRKIYEIKKRSKNKPLTFHISDSKFLKEYVDVNKVFKKLVKEFWPGPLTIIIDTADGSKGYRMPDNLVALKLIELAGVPVVAPSANISGNSPANSIDSLDKKISNQVDLIIDAGKCEIGTESTVIYISSDYYEIKRKGAISEDRIKEVLNTNGI